MSAVFGKVGLGNSCEYLEPGYEAWHFRCADFALCGANLAGEAFSARDALIRGTCKNETCALQKKLTASRLTPE